MKVAIVNVEIPDNEQAWLNFLSATGTIPANPHIKELARNVWEVDFEASPSSFAKLVSAIKSFGLPGRILQFDDAPQWLPVN